MAKLETIFWVTTWALMNVLLISIAFETTIAPPFDVAQTAHLAVPPSPPLA